MHNSQTLTRLSISLCKILLMSRIQSFLIFVGMSTIGLFKPWLKDSKTSKMESPNSADKYPSSSSIYVFLLPSLLDLAGTVVDTAGLFYVPLSLTSDKRISKPDAKRFSNIFHLHDNNILPQQKAINKEAHPYARNSGIAFLNRFFEHRKQGPKMYFKYVTKMSHSRCWAMF